MDKVKRRAGVIEGCTRGSHLFDGPCHGAKCEIFSVPGSAPSKIGGLVVVFALPPRRAYIVSEGSVPSLRSRIGSFAKQLCIYFRGIVLLLSKDPFR